MRIENDVCYVSHDDESSWATFDSNSPWESDDGTSTNLGAARNGVTLTGKKKLNTSSLRRAPFPMPALLSRGYAEPIGRF